MPAALLAGVGALPAASAEAAGPAVVNVSVSITDNATGTPLTELDATSTSYYAVNVAYSCSTVDCTGVQVNIAPNQLDPYYGSFRMGSSAWTWTPPYTPAPAITGNPNAGFTIDLGTVPVGSSGSFRVAYRINERSNPVSAGSFFPDGFVVTPTVTITAANADNPAVGSASATWSSTTPATPTLAISGAPSVRTDTDVVYNVSGDSRCVSYPSGTTSLRGSPWALCAASWGITVPLPAEADYVASSNGGVYDAGTNTVSWAATGIPAAQGIGNAGPYTITVRYPSDELPTDGAGCAIDVSVPAHLTMTYLDGQVNELDRSAVQSVQNCTPFASAMFDAKLSSRDAGTQYSPIVYIPDAPGDVKSGYYWQVDAWNRSNVAGVATIVDDALDQPDMPVYRIRTQFSTGTVQWTLDDGSTGTSAAPYTAPTGRRITAATVTSGSLAGPNTEPGDDNHTTFRVFYDYQVPGTAVPGPRTNTVSGSMTYPEYPELGTVSMGSTSRTVQLQPMPSTTPRFVAQATTSVVTGGGTPIPGSQVTFRFRERMAAMPTSADVVPQYVFLAPLGWSIDPGGASFPAGSVPVGTTFDYRTVTYLGNTYDAVVATWPSAADFGATDAIDFPYLSVATTPSPTAPAGANIAYAFAGDANHAYDETTGDYSSPYVDVTDFDADAVSTEVFASTPISISLGASAGLGVLKEICQPDATQPDGCSWIADSSILVGVAPTATAITYRVTLRNTGNATLSNLVAYDVLPFPGDTGTSQATASTARGSTVEEALASVTDVSAGVTLSYSASHNPVRDEVYPGAPGAVDDWGPTVTGARAIKAEIASLPQGESRSFTYQASLLPGAPAGAVGCNSVAANAATLAALEPPAVCATTQEADLRITAPDHLPLQVDREGSISFLVENLGGSPNAPATLHLALPAGLTISDLGIDDWTCDAPSGTGPVDVICESTNADLTPRPVQLGTPETVTFAVVPDAALAGDSVCVPADVTGPLYDPELGNNDATTCSLVVAGTPEVTLAKDDGRDLVAPGEQLTYTITLTNQLVADAIGDVVLTDELPDGLVFVAASDGGAVAGQNPDGTAGTVTWTLPALQPVGTPTAAGDGTSGGADSTRVVTVTVEVADTATGTIDNLAGVSAPDPDDPSVTITAEATDSDDVQFVGLTLVKSADPLAVTTVGQEVTFGFEVTNTGNVPLDGLTIDDGLAGLSAIDCPVTTLAVAGSTTCSATYHATAADFVAGQITNTATATASPAIGDPATSAPSTAVVTAPQAAALTLSKSATESSFSAAGQTLHFTFQVANTGNVPVTSIVVGDQLPGTAPVTCAATALQPGASTTCQTTYTTTPADVDAGVVINTALVTAAGPSGPVNAGPASVTVPGVQTPSIGLVKSAAETSFAAAGTTLHYSFVVTNTGNVTLTGVGVSETLAGVSAVACPSSVLPAGASQTCTATYLTTGDDVDAGAVVNTATASGTAPSGAPVASAPSSVEVPAAQAPAISLVKTVDEDQIDTPGMTLHYSFLVSNTGNVTLTGIDVTDTLPGISAATCDATTLAAGESTTCAATYETTQADFDEGHITNTATATGTPPTGPDVTSPPAIAQIPPVQLPAVAVVKTATETSFSAAGVTLHFEFEVTNTGNVTLHDLAVADPLPGVTAVACPETTLGPGAATTCTATYLTTAADVDLGSVTNTAAASATGPGAAAVTSPVTELVVDAVQLPALTLAKVVDATSYAAAGTALHYTLTVTNSGNVTLTGVVVDDPLAGLTPLVCSGGDVLAAGAAATCTATYTTTQADLDAGRTIANSALAEAVAPGGAPVASPAAAVSVTAARHPALGLVKSAAAPTFTAGAVVTYRFALTNSGNVTLTQVGVTDGLAGLSAVSCPQTTLAPAGSTLCTATYTATQADFDAGAITNTATAGANGPGGTPVASAPSTVTVTASGVSPGVEIVKTVAEPSYAAGTVLHYSFLVTNTGNVTLAPITVEDPMAGLSAVTCPVASLAPGASTTCAATYVATDADVAAGSILNTATVTGAIPGMAPVTSGPSTAVLEAEPPVVPPAPTDPGPAPTDPPADPTEPGLLPVTGGSLGMVPFAGLVLVAGFGAVALASARRRTRRRGA